LALAYLVLFWVVPVARRRLATFGERVSVVLNTPAPVAFAGVQAPSSHIIPEAPASLTPLEDMQTYSAYDGFRSFAPHGGALTIDDIVKGLSKAPVMPAPLSPQVEPIFDHVEPIYENVEALVEEAQAPAPAIYSAPVPNRRPAPSAAPAPIPSEIPAFLEALVRGDREEVFGMVRTVVREGGDAEAFLTQVTCALDDAYRARLEGTSVHQEIERLTARLATPVLERLVTAFASAVDSSYSVGITGAKLALTRALATLGA